MKYDAIFIGAGISSLYANYLFLKKYPNSKTIILEKSNHIGGRISWDYFNGIEIATGAGVGRFKKDKLLLELLDDFNIKYNIYESEGIPTVKAIIRTLESSIHLIVSDDTFRSFGIRVLGLNAYNRFVKESGYSDFEKFEPITALKYYGFEDLYDKQKYFQFSWKQLITCLQHGMNIKKNRIVTKIKNGFVMSDSKIYVGSHVFVGVTINCLRRLFPNIYPSIHSQHFIRIYVQLNKRLQIPNYTICNNILQKFISIKDNLYMIYADNKNADVLKKMSKKNIAILLQTEFKDIGIKVLEKKIYFWSEGTHYYNSSTFPDPFFSENITIIGELISKNQGWCGPVLQNIKELIFFEN